MVQIITDSTSDLSVEQAQDLQVQVIPLTVHFGELAYLDGVEISAQQFYDKLAASGDTLPSTSQVNPSIFVALFEQILAKGDDVVGIFLSSELSGTYQSACIAREMTDPSRIHLIDSGLVTFPLGLLVSQAAQLRNCGLSASDIATQITALSKRVRMLAVLDTLKYLKLGGRISTATAIVGGALGITPIVGLKDGKVVSLGKSRGRKAGFKWILNQLEEEPIDSSLGVAFGHTNCPDAMDACMEFLSTSIADVPSVSTHMIGSVVGTHAGPGAAGIAYFVKEG